MKTYTTRGDFKTSARVRGASKGATTEAEATVTSAGTDRNGLDVVLYDATGAELDFRKENENWSAADHGILTFGRDIDSTPNKYRAIALDPTGRLYTVTASTTATTATRTTVADSATDVQLLAANSNRIGATICNDSSAELYLALGTTASATDYTARIVQNGYYEVPYGYTGQIRGIWASDPGDGAARITELT